MDTDTTRKATPEDLARKRAELDRAARSNLWAFLRIILAFAAVFAMTRKPSRSLLPGRMRTNHGLSKPFVETVSRSV